MAKKKKHKHCDLSPEGLWISPTGERLEITEHLLAIKRRPDLFDIAEDTSQLDTPALREWAVRLIEDGWTRFRFLDNVWYFEIVSSKTHMRIVEDGLVECGAHEFENVRISQLQPKKEFEGTVAEVYERTIVRFQSNPKKNKWRLS